MKREDRQVSRSKQGWRHIEQQARERLRIALEQVANAGAELDDPMTRALRNVAVTAAVAKDKAYPQDLQSDKFIQIPARLLQEIAIILRKPPQPIVEVKTTSGHNLLSVSEKTEQSST